MCSVARGSTCSTTPPVSGANVGTAAQGGFRLEICLAAGLQPIFWSDGGRAVSASPGISCWSHLLWRDKRPCNNSEDFQNYEEPNSKPELNGNRQKPTRIQTAQLGEAEVVPGSCRVGSGSGQVPDWFMERLLSTDTPQQKHRL